MKKERHTREDRGIEIARERKERENEIERGAENNGKWKIMRTLRILDRPHYAALFS